MSTITLYRHPLSGHSHRAELLLSLLAIDANIVDVDLMAGEHKQPEFLQKNRFGQVPVLEDGSSVIADSNAILVYLASKYDPDRHWLPVDSQQAAEVQYFLSVAAGPLAAGPASARLVNVFGAGLDHEKAKDSSHTLLSVLNDHLQDRDWLVGNRATIADVANYAYIAHAPEGDVALDNYPAMNEWLKRIEHLPDFVAMQITAVGLAA